MDRLFEQDFNSNGETFMMIYVDLFKFLIDVKYITVPSFFDECLILISRYYLHYIPSLKSEGLLSFDDSREWEDQLTN